MNKLERWRDLRFAMIRNKTSRLSSARQKYTTVKSPRPPVRSLVAGHHPRCSHPGLLGMDLAPGHPGLAEPMEHYVTGQSNRPKQKRAQDSETAL